MSRRRASALLCLAVLGPGVAALVCPSPSFGQAAPAGSASAPPAASSAPLLAAASSDPAAQAPPTPLPPAPPTEGLVKTGTRAQVLLAGYVEAYYAFNFNRPSNGVTNYRGFDNRHNSFTLSNAVLDTSFSLDAMSGRLALQFGHTGASYYASEPALPATGGANASDDKLWRYIQQANLGYKIPVGAGLLTEAGLFLSPIGPEGMAVKDQWNWSRSNLFVGLPFYHTGARVSYPLTGALGVTFAVYNGWNSVVDNNDEKSVSASFAYAVPDRLNAQLLYFGGVERPTGATEGRAFRHLLDAYFGWSVTRALSLLVHGDGGFERNLFGTSSWLSGAVYARLQLAPILFLALRADRFNEWLASNAAGTAAPLFWPAKWVSSATATVELRPQDNLSVRLEYRHDESEADLFFKGALDTSPKDGSALPNARRQDTLLLGAVAWF